MGMAASSLRFAQLTARKNQVEFEGQQINQQRLTLSQKSSAIYNDMLTKQVPTAPDPSAFTKIVYKFNNGFGTSSILNLARKRISFICCGDSARYCSTSIRQFVLSVRRRKSLRLFPDLWKDSALIKFRRSLSPR